MSIFKSILNFIVKKRRYFLLGVIISSVLVLVLSASGLLQYTAYVKREDQAMLKNAKDDNSKRKQKFTLEYDEKDLTQEIFGLYLPNYNENGKILSVIRGAYAVFLKNNIYKIMNPEIEFPGTSSEEDNQPETIVVTSDFGEIEKTTNEGFLHGNIIIRLQENFKIYTEDLDYFPVEKRVSTNGRVRIRGEGTDITGTGFEVNLPESQAWVKNDPEMKISGDKHDLLLFPDTKSEASNSGNLIDTKKGKAAEDIFIRSSGELFFDNAKKIIMFFDNVRVSKGESTIFSDKLVILFDSGMENVNEVTASGNVLASDGAKTAKGESLTWSSEKQAATLEDEPVAEYFDSKVSISASKIVFFKNQNKVDVPVEGQLVTKVKVKGKEGNEQDDNKEANMVFESDREDPTYETITVSWKGSMLFLQDEGLAVFEEDVLASKEGVRLYSDKLVVSLDEEKGIMKKLEATKDVHLIQKRDNSFSEARGAHLIWTAPGNHIELFGDPLASVKDGERHLSAQKIFFSEDENDLLAEGRGSLLVKSHTKKEGKTEFIDINWTENMVYSDKDKIANFYGNVITVKGAQKLDCDRLDVLFHDKEKVKKITALGNVYIVTSGSDTMEGTEGIGTLLVWDLPEGLAVLTGNPLAELRRSDTRTFSDRVYFDTNTQRVHWEGKPHWQIYEKKAVN